MKKLSEFEHMSVFHIKKHVFHMFFICLCQCVFFMCRTIQIIAGVSVKGNDAHGHTTQVALSVMKLRSNQQMRTFLYCVAKLCNVTAIMIREAPRKE